MNRNIELFRNQQWGLFVNLAAEKISTQLNFNKILIATINISAVTFVVIDLSSKPELLKYLASIVLIFSIVSAILLRIYSSYKATISEQDYLAQRPKFFVELDRAARFKKSN